MFFVAGASDNAMFGRGQTFYLFAESVESFVELLSWDTFDEWRISGTKIDPTKCGTISEEELPQVSLSGVTLKEWAEDYSSRNSATCKCFVIPVSLA